MPKRCSICSRTDVASIDVLLLEGRSARSVALDLGLSEDTMQRHHHRHVFAAAPLNLDDARRRSAADPLDELVEALRSRALAGDVALSAQADVRHAILPTRRLEEEEEWIDLRTRMLAALEPFPEARLAIAAALEPAP